MPVAPRRIRRGSKVAIVSPASAIDADRLHEGLNIIQEVGLTPVLGPCVKNLRSVGLHAAPLEDRLKELHWAFGNPEISAVICAKGGTGSAGLLPYLDYRLIKKSMKPLLGRSDITALNVGILKHAGLITINGQSPNIHLDKGQGFRDGQEQSLAETLELMMSSRPWLNAPFQKNGFIPRTVRSGRARGHAIGCNLDTFTRLIGTPHLPNLNGAILFIEDIHKSVEGIYREFMHLQLSGILGSLSGVVIGEFEDFDENRREDLESVIQEFFNVEVGPPCVYGYSFSHGATVSAIPIGAMCHLDADTAEISFDFCMA